MNNYENDNEEENSEGEDEQEIEESLPLLEKLHKYINSGSLQQRVHLAKELPGLAKELEYSEHFQHVIPALTKLSADKEPIVRQSLAEHLPSYSSYLYKNSTEDQISKVIIPLFDTLLFDDNLHVRATSRESFTAIMKYLDVEKQKSSLIPLISKLSFNSRVEDHRVEAAELLGKVAGVLEEGEERIKEFMIEQIKRLAKDPMFRVRKSIALSIGPIAKYCGPDLSSSSLLPVFLQLTKDDIWGVKKACTESIVSLASSVSLPARVNDLSKIYEYLIQDSSRWVRNAAFQNLGQFITTLANGSDISTTLVKYYCGMADGMRNKYADNDTVLYCAYSFPGVLLTFGRDQWPSLKPVYSALSVEGQWKVRRTLAHSIHEIAKILGRELAEVELVNTFEKFLRDMEQVRVGVIRNFASFLSVLSPSLRSNYLNTLIDLHTHSSNWRFRFYLASQIGEIAGLYGDEVVKETVVPMALALCKDQVTSVRHAAAAEMGRLVNHIRGREVLLRDFIDQLTHLAYGERYSERQLYVMCCESIAREGLSPQLLMHHLLPHVIALSEDKVSNVRFVVSRLLHLLRSLDRYASIETQLQPVIDKLAADPDPDVRYFLHPPSGSL